MVDALLWLLLLLLLSLCSKVLSYSCHLKVGKFTWSGFELWKGRRLPRNSPISKNPAGRDISGKQSQTLQSTLRKEGRDYCPQPTHASQHHPRPPTKETTKSFCGVGSMMGFIYASRIVYRDWLSSLSRLPLSSREKNRCFKGVIHLL